MKTPPLILSFQIRAAFLRAARRKTPSHPAGMIIPFFSEIFSGENIGDYFCQKIRLFWQLAICAACLCTAGAAQTIDTSFILRGVDQSVNEFLLPIGTATECINWDLGKTVGTATKRDGYDFYQHGKSSATLVTEGYTGIYGHVGHDGEKRLFSTVHISHIAGADTTAMIYDDIAYSEAYGDSVYTEGRYYQYYGAGMDAITYGDIIVMANGYNRPQRYNGSNIDVLVERAPGGFELAPCKDTGGGQVLNGDYYYGFRAAMPDSVGANTAFHNFPDSMNLSNLSYRIHVDSDWVLIHAPSWTGKTHLCSSPDSTIIQVGRTRAGGTENDSMFLITTWRIANTGTGGYILDSIPDDSLGVGTYPFVGYYDTVTHTACTLSDSLYRLGQVQWDDTKDDTTGGIGFEYFDGLSDTTSWTHTRYVMCYFDSSTGMLSAPGPFQRIGVDTTNSGKPMDSSYHLFLPPATSNETHLWRILYRAREYTDSIPVNDSNYIYSYKTIAKMPLLKDPCPDGDMVMVGGSMWCRTGKWQRSRKNYLYSMIDPYYPVDTIKSSSTTSYIDTTAWAIVEARTPLEWSTELRHTSFPLVFQDRIFLARGSEVLYSDAQTPGFWPVGNSHSFNADDGDEITGLHAGDGYIDVFKNRSWFRATLEDDGTNVFLVSKVVEPNIGCIAPRSIIDVPGHGLAFLSLDGVYLFSGHLRSLYKSSGGNIGIVSEPIQKSLDAYTMATKRSCQAWITEDRKNLCFSFPAVDTTWVYALNGAGWSAWDMAFDQVTNYDTTYQTDMYPMTDVIGMMDGVDSLYKFGDVKTDDTVYEDCPTGDCPVYAYWTSAPLFAGKDYGVIEGWGVWKNSDDTCDYSMRFYTYTPDSSITTSVADSSQFLFRWYDLNIHEGLYFKMQIRGADNGLDSLAIRRVDLRYRPTGPGKTY